MKIAINPSIGGFNLTDEHYFWLIDNRDYKVYDSNNLPENVGVYSEKIIIWDDDWQEYNCYFLLSAKNRTNQDLIDCIEAIGSTRNAVVVEIPDDVDWYIIEHESGYEDVHERHRIWYHDEVNGTVEHKSG